MSNNFPLSPIDDFIVVGGNPTGTTSAAELRAWSRRTQETLDQAGDFTSRGRLSGSFIYAHPPDYRGRPTLRFSVADWRALFREFKELGLDTVIWQASAWMELGECYYPSNKLSGYRQWNVVEPMMQAANDEGMFLFLGTFGLLNGEMTLGKDDRDLSRAIGAAEQEIACYRELLELYRGGFQGYYLSSETYYHPERDPQLYTLYGTFFERVTNSVKELTPELKILASPAAIHATGHEHEAVERLLTCFGRAQVDFFAPMDCIGQGEELVMLEDDLKVWRNVSSATGAEFWTNCETFFIPDRDGAVMKIEPAEPRRFLYQMTVADRVGAKKLVTWEAMHFLDPNGSPEAHALRRAYLEHIAGLQE